MRPWLCSHPASVVEDGICFFLPVGKKTIPISHPSHSAWDSGHKVLADLWVKTSPLRAQGSVDLHGVLPRNKEEPEGEASHKSFKIFIRELLCIGS